MVTDVGVVGCAVVLANRAWVTGCLMRTYVGGVRWVDETAYRDWLTGVHILRRI